MMKMSAMFVLAAVVLIGCSTSSDEGSDETSVTLIPTEPSSTLDMISSSETAVTESTTTSEPNETTTTGVVDADPEVGIGVIEFVEVLSDLTEGTDYEDLVIEDPEVFVATGRLFCERLDDGSAPSDVLAEYVATLHGGDVADAPAEVLDLSGWLLGIAAGYLCPQHIELVQEMNP
jgi:hypothetical protein